MREPIRENAYYVATGHGPDAEVFLAEEGRLEATSQASQVLRGREIMLTVREAVGWWAPKHEPLPSVR
jgi:hypothetical protein